MTLDWKLLKLNTMKSYTDKRKTGTNSRFAKAGVSCFYESELLNSSFLHLMKFSAENPRLRKAAKRQVVKKLPKN